MRSAKRATARTPASGAAAAAQQKEKYKHEGDSVNTEVRCSPIDRILAPAIPGRHYDKAASEVHRRGGRAMYARNARGQDDVKVGGSSIELTSGGIKFNSPRTIITNAAHQRKAIRGLRATPSSPVSTTFVNGNSGGQDDSIARSGG